MKVSLIINDQTLQDLIVLLLLGEDYEIKVYSDQNTALADLEKEIPDIIISEFQALNINGLEICKILKKNFLFRYIPVLFIVSDSDLLNKAKITYAGADDYISKNCVENELLLKVKLNLYRIARQQDIHPLTKLPGQSSLYKELEKRIENKVLFSIYYADMYRLRDFNQRYGFKRGDEVIQYAASIILRALKECGSPSDFLSHPQDDDFIFLTLTDSIETIGNRIIQDFDGGIASFYNEEDRKIGGILLKNRKGDFEKTPILRIHIGITTNESYQFISPAQTIQIVSEIKSFAKLNFEKSMFVKERRKGFPFY
ncbi:MAG: response regulator [Candidatus Omnitrophota bacterium]|nr:response regulator [Candidatus Omnitrophota bacterium]MBU1929485.1 response regulator [Candidatus Omnitrophota bacterium]MBU2034946.1 response regulator [Candidatus Omnitrophota bacterium]MBU2258889.1 response regulator [Candidatus Omnitrophota bacterium]